HPVEDFLFTYYPVPPRVLRRWHTGARVVLADAAGSERAGWRWYATRGDDVTLDTAAFVEARGSSIRFIVSLLGATARREPRLGCFGLHGWSREPESPARTSMPTVSSRRPTRRSTG